MNERAGLGRRALARLVDALPFVAAAWSGHPLLYLLGVMWLLLADGLLPSSGGRASPGKWIARVSVAWYDPDAQARAPDLRESIVRNLPVAGVALLGIHPIGWVLLPVVGLGLLGTEVYLALRDPEGRRLGDRLAGTMVMGKRT